jgi:trigger factor
MELYLKSEDQSEEEFDAKLASDAEDAVRAQLVLDTVADAEQLGVNDTELTQEVVRRAQQADMSPQEYADQLVQAGQLPSVVADLRRGKALALVLENAKISDASGGTVDLDLLRQEMAVAPPEPTA